MLVEITVHSSIKFLAPPNFVPDKTWEKVAETIKLVYMWEKRQSPSFETLQAFRIRGQLALTHLWMCYEAVMLLTTFHIIFG